MFQPISREEYHKLKGPGRYGKDNCPFCNVSQNNSIIWEGKYWYILHCLSSYSGDHRHIMAVPIEHIQFSYELSKEHFEELGQVHTIVRDFFGKEEYFSFTRESMQNENSRSVEHLHMHFLVGDLEGKFLRKMLELQGFPITQDLKID
ncbi:MAG: hypothetical protein AB7E37_02250 [Candidatus Altimarinota bacterium]